MKKSITGVLLAVLLTACAGDDQDAEEAGEREVSGVLEFYTSQPDAD